MWSAVCGEKWCSGRASNLKINRGGGGWKKIKEFSLAVIVLFTGISQTSHWYKVLHLIERPDSNIINWKQEKLG